MNDMKCVVYDEGGLAVYLLIHELRDADIRATINVVEVSIGRIRSARIRSLNIMKAEAMVREFFKWCPIFDIFF
jgi:hypothetical protein